MLFTFCFFFHCFFFSCFLLFDACNRKIYMNSTKQQKKRGKREKLLQRTLMNARNTNNLIPKRDEYEWHFVHRKSLKSFIIVCRSVIIMCKLLFPSLLSHSNYVAGLLQKFTRSMSKLNLYNNPFLLIK